TWPGRYLRDPAGQWSSSNLSIAPYHPLGAGELADSHRTAGVQLLGRDPHLGPEPKLGAVDEAGRGVDHHRRCVDLTDEAIRRCDLGGHDRLGVAGAEALDVLD